MKSLYYRTITPLAALTGRWQWLAVALMLGTFFGLGITSMAHQSAIVDEVAHIPAAYSYLHYGDYRLNPEHPPLIKDLAGLPLQFMHLKFPVNQPGWTTEVNGEWDTGWSFIYYLGNNANAILFWARLPILLLGTAFVVVLYTLTRRRWGVAVALLTVFFYTFSPNILANARLVTTDLGSSITIFLAVMAFIRFVERPGRNNVILLSVALAAAQLSKFNGVLLYPYMAGSTVVVAALWHDPEGLWRRIRTYTGRLIGASAISVIWIWLYYIPHTLRMPLGVQDRLIDGSLVSPGTIPIAHVLTTINHWPLFKPLVQFLLGVTMVVGRVAGGNVTYFNGQVTNGSFRGYFFEMFAVKTQVAFLILGLILLGLGLWRYFRRRPFAWTAPVAAHVRANFPEWTLGMFALFYFLVSVAGNLNLGIRHILPVYIPLFVLVAIGTVKLMRHLSITRARLASAVTLAVLLVWYGLSMITIYPSYLAYFNELIGGPGNAYKYFTDSGVDWGQDLIHLKDYVAQHPEIKHIAVDYFGGADPRYYFCVRKYDTHGQLIATTDGYDCSHSVYEDWHSQNGRYPGQYIAVSETYLENDIYFAGLINQPGYAYLRRLKPIAKVGYSIYVYKLY